MPYNTKVKMFKKNIWNKILVKSAIIVNINIYIKIVSIII